MPEKLPHFGVIAPTCPYCGVQITVHQSINPGHCDSMNCKLEHVQIALRRDAQLRREEQDRVDAALLREAGAIRNAADVLHAELDAVVIETVPFQNRPVVPLPHAAREVIVTHIGDVVAAAFADVNQASGDKTFDPRSGETPTPVEAAGCTACQGNCCSVGRQFRAFLSKSVMGKLILTNPN